jgi:UDP-N-acetyl-D-mannosaminuronic acid dehydrogenase
LGIAYKPGVGDVRESPALEVIRRLKSNGYVVRACDPYADNIPGLELLPLPEAIDGADCIVILTDHKEFKEPGFLEKLNDSINAVIIDTRGLLKRT